MFRYLSFCLIIGLAFQHLQAFEGWYLIEKTSHGQLLCMVEKEEAENKMQNKFTTISTSLIEENAVQTIPIFDDENLANLNSIIRSLLDIHNQQPSEMVGMLEVQPVSIYSHTPIAANFGIIDSRKNRTPCELLAPGAYLLHRRYDESGITFELRPVSGDDSRLLLRFDNSNNLAAIYFKEYIFASRKFIETQQEKQRHPDNDESSAGGAAGGLVVGYAHTVLKAPLFLSELKNLETRSFIKPDGLKASIPSVEENTIDPLARVLWFNLP